MTVPEPSQTDFDLRWRMFGVPVRIHPLFWASSALLGVRYYLDPEAGCVAYFVFWMAAVFAAVLAHQFGQVGVGRLLGMRGAIVLSGLGGLTLGVGALTRRWSRIVVLLAGPMVNGAIVVGVLGLTWTSFPAVLHEWGWASAVATGAAMLVRVNLYWVALNLLPLWPLDGGRIACELAEGLVGRRGVGLALAASIVVAGLLAVWATLQLSWCLSFPYDPRYVVDLTHFGVLLVFCFLFWALGFGAVWPLQGMKDEELQKIEG